MSDCGCIVMQTRERYAGRSGNCLESFLSFFLFIWIIVGRYIYIVHISLFSYCVCGCCSASTVHGCLATTVSTRSVVAAVTQFPTSSVSSHSFSSTASASSFAAAVALPSAVLQSLEGQLRSS